LNTDYRSTCHLCIDSAPWPNPSPCRRGLIRTEHAARTHGVQRTKRAMNPSLSPTPNIRKLVDGFRSLAGACNLRQRSGPEGPSFSRVTRERSWVRTSRGQRRHSGSASGGHRRMRRCDLQAARTSTAGPPPDDATSRTSANPPPSPRRRRRSQPTQASRSPTSNGAVRQVLHGRGGGLRRVPGEVRTGAGTRG
jgi:hypothetical protein